MTCQLQRHPCWLVTIYSHLTVAFTHECLKCTCQALETSKYKATSKISLDSLVIHKLPVLIWSQVKTYNGNCENIFSVNMGFYVRFCDTLTLGYISFPIKKQTQSRILMYQPVLLCNTAFVTLFHETTSSAFS